MTKPIEKLTFHPSTSTEREVERIEKINELIDVVNKQSEKIKRLEEILVGENRLNKEEMDKLKINYDL